MNMKTRKFIADFFTYLVLGLGSVIFLTPIAWLLSTSLKDNQQVFRMPPSLIPSPVLWENYRDALTTSGLPFGRFFLNSIVIVCLATIGAVISSSIVSYSFARVRWKGRDSLFFIVIMTMVIPAEVIIVPQFVIYNTIGWVDTYLPLVAPSFFGLPFHIFILRQYMRGIPIEMDEAAEIDGCNRWSILWRIIFPQSKAAVLTIVIYSIQSHWNAFMEPLIYLNTMEKFTVTLGLSFFKGQFGTQWGLLMAASVMVVLPILLLSVAAQKQFIQGIVVSGVKG